MTRPWRLATLLSSFLSWAMPAHALWNPWYLPGRPRCRAAGLFVDRIYVPCASGQRYWRRPLAVRSRTLPNGDGVAGRIQRSELLPSRDASAGLINLHEGHPVRAGLPPRRSPTLVVRCIQCDEGPLFPEERPCSHRCVSLGLLIRFSPRVAGAGVRQGREI